MATASAAWICASAWARQIRRAVSSKAVLLRAPAAAARNCSASISLRSETRRTRDGSGKTTSSPSARACVESGFRGGSRLLRHAIFPPACRGHRPALSAGLRVSGSWLLRISPESRGPCERRRLSKAIRVNEPMTRETQRPVYCLSRV
jgi:hypothetical protein